MAAVIGVYFLPTDLTRGDKQMGRLTTHVLDAAHGCPGSSIKVELYRVEGQQLELVNSVLTNSDGRVDAPLLQGEDYRSGVYQLQFSAGDYYRARGVALPEPAFLDVVVLRFGIDAGQEHYHVPLLISPYSYSTYRGS
jgi:5-hydroxyisourate hydrolase